MSTTMQPDIAKGTEGFIIHAPSGSNLTSAIYQVRVKMVRNAGTHILTTLS